MDGVEGTNRQYDTQSNRDLSHTDETDVVLTSFVDKGAGGVVIHHGYHHRIPSLDDDYRVSIRRNDAARRDVVVWVAPLMRYPIGPTISWVSNP